MMRNFAYLTLIFYILTFTLVPQTYAQDGGDGVSGAGADNQSYDSGPTDTSGSGEGEESPGGGGGTAGGGGGSGSGVGEGTGDAGAPAGGNEASVTPSDVAEARADQTEAWGALQDIENGRSEGNYEQALQSYLEASAYADTLAGQLATENRNEPVTEADVQAAQGSVNSAAEAHSSAQSTRESALAAWNETKGTPEEFAAFNAYLDANGKLEASVQNLTAAEVAAANAAAAYSQTQTAATQSSGAQEGKQSEVAAAGTSAISGGNTDLDSVISGSGLAGAGLSADRNASIIGGWAQQLGIEPGQAAAYAAHFAAGQAGASVSSVAGSAAIAAQSAGGTSEQMAASAAAAAAMQVASTGGNPDQQSAASRDAGLATYTTSINSSSMSADEKAAAITSFGVANGNSVAQVAAAVSTTGADKDASIAGIAAAFQANGSTGTSQQLGSLASGGWGTSPAAGAAATGAQTGGAAITNPGGAQPAGGSGAATGATGTGVTQADQDKVDAKFDSMGRTEDKVPSAAGLQAIGQMARENGWSPQYTASVVNAMKNDLTGFETRTIEANINIGYHGVANPREVAVPGQIAPNLTGPNGEPRSFGDLANGSYGANRGAGSTAPSAAGAGTQPGSGSNPTQSGQQAAPAAGNTPPDVNGVGLTINQHNSALTIDTDGAGRSYSFPGTNNTISITVSAPNSAAHNAGQYGQVEFIDPGQNRIGEAIPITNEAAVPGLLGSLQNNTSGPSPSQLSQATGKDASTFGGK